MSDKVEFLHIDKHESWLEIDTMILMEMVKHSQSFQNSKVAMFLQYLKKRFRDEVDFLHADKHQSSLQVDINNLGIKVFWKVILSLLMGMIKHCQSARSNKFAISLQYLKKEVRNGVHFLHIDKHQSFYKVALSFLMEVARHAQSTQNRKLLIFLQYIKKKMLQLLLCYNVMQNIQIFYGGPVMFVVTCFTLIFFFHFSFIFTWTFSFTCVYTVPLGPLLCPLYLRFYFDLTSTFCLHLLQL